jgi:hypothetical protein
MINEALVFLKNSLNSYLNSGRNPEEAQEDPVVFLEGKNMDPLTFKSGAVSILLINLEEETTLRAPDQYQRISPDGTRQKVYPDIRLNLYVLLVAHFDPYENSLHYLSLIIRYFQNHRLLDHQNAPELSENIEQLAIELVTLPFSEQNEVWSALRVTYHPSVLYKVKMVIFKDEDAVGMPEIEERILRIVP